MVVWGYHHGCAYPNMFRICTDLSLLFHPASPNARLSPKSKHAQDTRSKTSIKCMPTRIYWFACSLAFSSALAVLCSIRMGRPAIEGFTNNCQEKTFFGSSAHIYTHVASEYLIYADVYKYKHLYINVCMFASAVPMDFPSRCLLLHRHTRNFFFAANRAPWRGGTADSWLRALWVPWNVRCDRDQRTV